MNASHPPIHIDPLLADVYELLHRMTRSQDQALGWYAWDAIKKLQQYEEQHRVAMAADCVGKKNGK
ncbi:hypothetical protein [Burkholderia pseudomallei]|uniref:hypothetical protein n=1 Tax=Burkholderia pseudomallei TaxID=28450 RepID=UPI000A1A0804|nr:hypothetical protein [Burkholderia pseudomallei]ARL90988.1 hypothetical protein BOC57_34975 [Burkholderia pseudomallei]